MFYRAIKNSFADLVYEYDEITDESDYIVGPIKIGQAVAPLFNKEADLRVLDLGCGTGLVAKEVKSTYPNAHITGLDSLKTMLDLAFMRRRIDDGLQIDLAEQGLPFPDNHFDLVVSCGLAEHLHNQTKFIGEMARVTKNGGHIVSTFMRKDWQHTKHMIAAATNNMLVLGNKEKCEALGYSTKEDHLRTDISNNDLELKEIETFSAYHLGPLKKPNYILVNALKP